MNMMERQADQKEVQAQACALIYSVAIAPAARYTFTFPKKMCMKKKYVSEKIICIKKYVSEKLICIKKTSCGLIYSVAIAPAARYFPPFCYFFF